MSNRSAMVFSGKKKKVNTFIGGVAALINTPALLAGKLSLIESDIKNFEIVGSDIQCSIGVNYEINTSSFVATGVTNYYDNDGYCTKLRTACLQNGGSLLDINFPNVEVVESYALQRTGLTEINLPSCILVKSYGFYRNDARLKNVILPVCTTLETGTNMRLCTKLEICYIPLVTTMGSNSLYNNVFQDIKTGATITANSYLQTNNSGSEDGDLDYAKNTRNANIIYV